jgi:hypothetical protein
MDSSSDDDIDAGLARKFLPTIPRKQSARAISSTS